MADARYDQGFWERLWTRTLLEHADKLALKRPNALLTAVAATLPPGRALDAGCGHGVESLWLAAHGWTVTAVDFSASALAHARERASAADLQGITWIEGDLTAWTPEPAGYDLVTSLYVHVPGPLDAMVARLAGGVAPGGTLLLVGHQPIDPATGAPTAAAGQTQVTVAAALAALTEGWELVVAEERPRATGGGVDAIVQARRR